MGIKIDEARNKLLSEQANKLLKDYYCQIGETSPQQAFARASKAYSYGDNKLAQRIYDYASKGWFMFASPV
jgi:ribonucleoside-diphosphate reductase alpha chain